MSDQFYNQPGRVARMFLLVGCPLIALGIPAAILWRHPHQPGVTFNTLENCAVGGFIALPIGVAMLLCCLLTLPAARRASMIFCEFEAGKYLARWKYDDAYWHGYIDGEQRRLRKVSYGTFGIIVAGGMFVLIIMVVNIPESGRRKAIDGSVMMAVILGIAFTVASIVRAYANNRCRRLMNCGEAIIASHAAYMGGDLAFWGYGMRALQSARFVPGTPAMIELAVGLNNTARNATRVLNLVTAATVSPAYRSQSAQVELIPVPPGSEAAAREIVKVLGELYLPAVATGAVSTSAFTSANTAAPAGASASNTAPVTPAIIPVLPTKPAPSPITWEALHRRARRWWRITAITATIGIALFVTAVVLDFNVPQPHQATLGDSLAFWGFMLLIVSVLIVPIATYKTLRARRKDRHRNRPIHRMLNSH